MKNILFACSLFLTALVSCSSDDPETILINALEKDSVALNALDLHDITYENTANGATHTDFYCPNGLLGDKGLHGTWSVSGNDLTVNDTTNGTAFTYQTTNAMLEVNTSYNTTTGEIFKVTKIQESFCL